MPKIYSFGMRYGRPPVGARIFSALSIPNPSRSINIYSGLHPVIQKYVESFPKTAVILQAAKKELEKGGDVAFGCQFGCHRSVALAELLHKLVPKTEIVHRDLHRHNKIHGEQVASKDGDGTGTKNPVGVDPAVEPASTPSSKPPTTE